MFGFAVRNLLSRPLRTILSVLGLTVAIAGMVGLFSIAGGIDQLVSNTFEQIPGLLVQQRGAPMPLFSVLPAAWEAELADLPGVTAVNAQVLTRVNRIEKDPVLSPPRFLLGVDIPSRLRLRNGVYDTHLLPGGRFLNEGDRGARHCLISQQIAEQFDKVVGDTLQVNGYDLKIVGIYHCGSLLLDVNILVDIDVVREMARIDPQTVSCFYLEHDGEQTDRELSRKIEQHFHGRDARLWQPSMMQKLLIDMLMPAPVVEGPDARPEPSSSRSDGDSADPEEESPVEVRGPEDWAERFGDFTADLKLFLTTMTGVGLLIAVFSIVNTMLMSVTERMIEFGILRANGWSRGNVLRLISCESALLGAAGGCCGAIIGWCAVQGINAWQPDRMRLYAGPGLLLFSVAFSTVLGLLGGLYPAWRAASKPPMESIRRI